MAEKSTSKKKRRAKQRPGDGNDTPSSAAASPDDTARAASRAMERFAEDRREAFRHLARRRGRGEIVAPPWLLAREERRLHVRSTLREDHHARIRQHPEAAEAKFAKLAESPFDFFRGTALLFYRDLAGADAAMPQVLAVGDVHPENFGAMPNRDGSPFFGINDFDEAHFAPFTWDLRRGALGFWLVARQQGRSKKKRRKTVRAFVAGYLDGLLEFARDDRESERQLRIDNSPAMIRGLLEGALAERREFLDGLLDLDKGRFRPTAEIVPLSSQVERFQEVIDRYREESEIGVSSRAGHFEVKDVAVKKGSGTASLGLDRYYVLIDGPSEDPADDLVLELKQARRSALAGLVPPAGDEGEEGEEGDGGARDDATGEAARIVTSQQVHLVGGDPYFGRTELDGTSLLVRERSPFKEEIDLDDLDAGELREYAGICGRVLAQAHARSDADTGVQTGDAEQRILAAAADEPLIADLVRFAQVAAHRLLRDYELFLADRQLGAFRLSVAGWQAAAAGDDV